MITNIFSLLVKASTAAPLLASVLPLSLLRLYLFDRSPPYTCKHTVQLQKVCVVHGKLAMFTP
jgi:hypothetical protein